MKIATWNVNGIRAREAQFAEWMAAAQPDIVCLQELKASPAQIPQSICDLEGYACYWHGGGGYSGVGLHVRRAAFQQEPVFTHPHFDHENRMVQTQLDDTIYLSVYVPNGGKDFEQKMAFLHEMDAYVQSVHAQGLKLVLCGDLNIARTDMDVHPKERKPVIGQSPKERALLEQILSRGLVDVGRMLYPDDDGYFTWWAPWRNMRQRNIGWRLDYVLVSEELAKRAVSCPSYREVGTSDHAPVVATFA
ncbi:MAG: exodeoxyribonuclease III [Acidobacteria bacterium]|nr:exodeoxyribonuclease III [Acidobacteriota bacterium]